MAAIFGDMSAGARLVYTVVGLSALIVLFTSFRLVNRQGERVVSHLPG